MEIKTPDLHQAAVTSRKNDHATHSSRAGVEATTPVSSDKLTVSEQAQQTIKHPARSAKSEQRETIVDYDRAVQVAQTVKAQIHQNPTATLQGQANAHRGLTASLLSNPPSDSATMQPTQAQQLAQEIASDVGNQPAQALQAQATQANAELLKSN